VKISEIRVRKWNPKTNAWELEVLPYDVKPIFVSRKTATANGPLDMGTYSVTSGKFAVITGIKFISETVETWFSIGGAVSDYHYMPAKGVDMLTGTAEDPVFTLDEGESVNFGVMNALSGVTYGIIIYGCEREKKPLR